jgi:hypothetical protein
MAGLTEYFERTAYRAKYQFGTRVFGRWNKIPFVGSIYGDSLISPVQGPRLSIHLDLPIKFQDKIYNILIDSHRQFKDIRLLVDIEISTENPDSSKVKRKVKK